MNSKEDIVLEAFFNSPKQWHFEELKEHAKISRDRLNAWLKRFENEGLITRVKSEGKMPHYIANSDSMRFRLMKRMFAFKRLVESGFFDHLSEQKGVKAAILFGSFSRDDWYQHSDIDIFILGDDRHVETGRFERVLKREIQVHTAKDAKDLKRMEGLLPSIVSGEFIKGNIDDLGVKLLAQN